MPSGYRPSAFPSLRMRIAVFSAGSAAAPEERSIGTDRTPRKKAAVSRPLTPLPVK